MGDYAKAIANYDNVIKFNPADAMALNNRGNAYAKLRQFYRAIADLSQALNYKPGFAPAHVNRGVTYAAKCDINRALAFEQAIRLDPQNSMA